MVDHLQVKCGPASICNVRGQRISGKLPVGCLMGGVAEIPLDVWAKVFRRLQVPDSVIHGVVPPVPVKYWQLPLVCQTFKNVFSKHAELASRFAITQQPSASSQPSLLAWLKAHARHLQFVDISCWPVTIADCLTALAQPWSSITSVSLNMKGQASLSRHSYGRPVLLLDLAPLRGLPNLSSLTLLEGQFINLSAAGALTHLDIVEADAMSPEFCDFVSCLVKLRAVNSSLRGLHNEGVTACSALQELHLYGNCSIPGETDNDLYHSSKDTYTFVPHDMPCLTSVTSLKLNFWGATVDLASMCALPALQSLELVVSGGCTVPPALVGLCQLRNLSISQEGDEDLGIEIFIDWRALPALQQLQLAGTLVVDSAIWELAEVKSLKSINFWRAHFSRDRHPDLPTIVAADVQYHIVAQRPEIRVERHASNERYPSWYQCTCTVCNFLRDTV